MMRVAVIVSRLAQLGPVNVMVTLVNSLADFGGVDTRLFYLDETVDPEIKLKVPVKRYVSGSFCFGDYDIIHTSGIRPDLIAYANRRKIKFHISTIHNYVFEDLTFTYNKLTSLVFGNLWLIIWNRADKLVCVSASLREYYSKWLIPEKLEVIHDGIAETGTRIVTIDETISDINALRSRGLRIIGCAGKLTRRKGIDMALDLAESNEKIGIIIFGDGKDLDSLKRLAKKKGIADRTVFAGFKSNAVNYFRYFDVFLMPSRSEGFGLALVEAAQQKVPVVCSDIKVFRELFDSNEVTFFRRDEINSLNQAIEIAAKIGRSKVDMAYARFKEHYTDLLMTKRYFGLYQSLSSTNKS